jgi:signal transduction histidine kinase
LDSARDARGSKRSQLDEHLELMVLQRTEELDKAYRALEKLDRTKSDFIEVAAHELRTPLSLIKGYAQLLETELSDSPQVQRLLEGILAGQTRLNEIISSMLDVSRIDSQVLEMIQEPTVLSPILERLRHEFRTALDERGLTLTLAGLDSLPPIEADTGLLYKVFFHLVVNAIKYTPDGGKISVSGALIADPELGSALEIVVGDTGIGIDPAHHELIFEKFYQTGQVSFHSSGRTKFKGGGPGLGLAIARGIVRAHSGRIWVESESYDEETCPGSRFHVLLPVAGQPAREG